MIEQKQLERASLVLSVPVINFFVLLAFVYGGFSTGTLSQPYALLIGFSLVVAIPVIPILHASRKGWIDLEIQDKEERAGFFISPLFGYATAGLVFYLMQAHALYVMAASYAAITLIYLFINNFGKISVHTAGTAGPATALLWVFGPIAAPLYLLTIFVMWVRLQLEAHTLVEAFAGAVVAVIITAATFKLLY